MAEKKEGRFQWTVYVPETLAKTVDDWVGGSRNAWIIAAIEEKLAREKKNRRPD